MLCHKQSIGVFLMQIIKTHIKIGCLVSTERRIIMSKNRSVLKLYLLLN